MSTTDEQIRAMQRAWEFLLDLSSGREKRIPSATRARAQSIARHFPHPVEAEESYRPDRR